MKMCRSCRKLVILLLVSSCYCFATRGIVSVVCCIVLSKGIKPFMWDLKELLPDPINHLQKVLLSIQRVTWIFVSSFLYSHVECSEVQSYLCGENPLPLPGASAVVIREILSMYRDILAFLYSVVKLNTIFCFNLLQDQEALDRIVLLFSLEASLAGKVLVQSSSYCFRRQLKRFWPMSRDAFSSYWETYLSWEVWQNVDITPCFAIFSRSVSTATPHHSDSAFFHPWIIFG